MSGAPIARRMWTRFEPLHDVTYFTPEARSAFEAAGLRGFWRGYFAGRTAPLGAVGASTVVATYFGFAPGMVARAVPDVWTRATPEVALRARTDGATAALTRLLAETHAELARADVLDEAVTLAERAVDGLDLAGRVLGAANAALGHDPDAPPLARLWQAATTLREHRGDGHVAALVAYGFDGCESVVWRTDPDHRAEAQQGRGWTDAQWDAATLRLTERGWLDETGAHTDEGTLVYAAVEDATDRAAQRGWTALGTTSTQRLSELLMPLAITAYTAIPKVNPINLPDPAKAA